MGGCFAARQLSDTDADTWVRVSFAHTRVSIVGWIYDPDHSLPPGMYVDVPHLDCLVVADFVAKVSLHC
jgi:hypothetical protein